MNDIIQDNDLIENNLVKNNLVKTNKKQRDNSIDYMKGILVILMIFAHISNFFPSFKMFEVISLYVNVTTFSGFMFCFGFVSYFAYISKEKKEIKMKLIKSFIKTLICFYISSCVYLFCVSYTFNIYTFLDIILLKSVAGYSEFLLSFALLYLIIYISFKYIKIIISKKIYLIMYTIVSLLLTFIPYHLITNNILGSIIGTTKFSSFPIMQYSSYFIIGAFIAKNKIIFNKYILIFSILGTAFYYIYYLIFNLIPSRTPPNIFWITGAYLYIYLYYIYCKKVDKKPFKIGIENIGKNTLLYLIVSNVFIFVLRYLTRSIYIFNTQYVCLIYFVIILIIILICNFIQNNIIQNKFIQSKIKK